MVAAARIARNREPFASRAVAGTGFIEGDNGVRVGSWQVLTHVSQASRRRIAVQVLQLDWRLAISFASPRDPGFIAFWQRWNHPHPRPELLE